VPELLYKGEIFQLVGLRMEIRRELGKGHDEVIYKDALVVEPNRAGVPFSREKNYEITYKGVVLPHYYYADFVVWDKILFEAKAVERLTDSAHQTSVELSGCLETSHRITGQFRCRRVGMEAGHFMDTNRTERDTNYTNYHEHSRGPESIVRTLV
jgi:GxxExxY protein